VALKKILIIEDNLLNLELVQDLLELSGYQVLSATMAEAGLELAKSENPDLILMDIRLPGLNGLEAIMLLKQAPPTQHIPVVALTADAMPSDRQRALAYGAAGYILKPIDTRQFASQVADFLNPGKPEFCLTENS
jgi:two-component system cell cycle response regulator DivK